MTTPSSTTPCRNFVPASFNPANWDEIAPLFARLQNAGIASAAEMETWLLQLSELQAAIDEFGSRRYIDQSCHTDDPAIEKAFMHFVEQIEPRLKPVYFELQKKFLASPHAHELAGPKFDVLRRSWKAEVEIFRPENVPLETEETKLGTEYDKITGAMMVEFRGQTYTMQQLAKFGEETDRATRQEAFELAARRRLKDRAALETIFEKMLPLRHAIAHNAGFDDYRGYMWKAKQRFDYTPADCDAFAHAIEHAIVPVVKELDRKRQTDLGVDRLRPWDLAVDQKSRPPLRPFDAKDIDSFVTKTKAMFNRMSPQLAEEFETLRTHGNLDLDSRKGKRPGGYQSSLQESGQPFIFMNAAGLQRDVETLLHEGGHAFHFLAASRVEPLVFLRHAPMEFCEVASMAMEALGSEHYDVFYADPQHAQRAKETYLEGVIRFFPWMATIDQFQHWIYTHPGHTAAQRTQCWLSLLDRFGGLADWTGYEDVRASRWQQQIHLYRYPFYYVEYGIAQLGALQLWMKAKEDPHRALAGYRKALALGGTRPLPVLFEAAGLRFDFSIKTIQPLMNAVREEMGNG